MSEEVYMTKSEVNTLGILIKIRERRLSKSRAAKELNISRRQVHRIYKKFLEHGEKALVSKKRGRSSNHQLSAVTKARVLEIISCETYSEFGPTFMSEKLEQWHGINISRETVRKMMIQEGFWTDKRKKRPVIHQQRRRRNCRGELVQIDGSPHAWFEDRGEPCALLLFIDDATGRTYGRFFEVEESSAYMILLSEYIKKWGKPQSLYSDRHGIFRVNMPGCAKTECKTQFGRVLEELGIKLLCANSPQAKGRVERGFKTLQDRLVKELRLAGISTIAEANQFLKTFWDYYNKKFEKPPEDSKDAHEKAPSDDELSRIICFMEYRKVSKNHEIQYKNTIYQLNTEGRLQNLAGSRVAVKEKLDGTIVVEYKGKSIPFRIFSQQDYVGKEVTTKEINRFLKGRQPRKVSPNHPWVHGDRDRHLKREYWKGIHR